MFLACLLYSLHPLYADIKGLCDDLCLETIELLSEKTRTDSSVLYVILYCSNLYIRYLLRCLRIIQQKLWVYKQIHKQKISI